MEDDWGVPFIIGTPSPAHNYCTALGAGVQESNIKRKLPADIDTGLHCDFSSSNFWLRQVIGFGLDCFFLEEGGGGVFDRYITTLYWDGILSTKQLWRSGGNPGILWT